jgi:hypothetical protein
MVGHEPVRGAAAMVGFSRVKLVVYVPVESADDVRVALTGSGAGPIGEFTRATFSSPAIGRYWPNPVATHIIGPVIDSESSNLLAEEIVERIEATVELAVLDDVVAAVREAHPYEEAPIDLYPLLDFEAEAEPEAELKPGPPNE